MCGYGLAIGFGNGFFQCEPEILIAVGWRGGEGVGSDEEEENGGEAKQERHCIYPLVVFRQNARSLKSSYPEPEGA